MWPFLTLAITLSAPFSLLQRARNATRKGWYPEPRGWTKRSMERPARPLLREELVNDWWIHRRDDLDHDVWSSAREELDRFIVVKPFKRDPRRREFLLKFFDGRESLDLPLGHPRRERLARLRVRDGDDAGVRGNGN